jgi:hypothetical protein
VAEGWERFEPYSRTESEEWMMFMTIASVLFSGMYMLGIPRAISVPRRLHRTTMVWKINRRAMTTEIPDLMEAALCIIQPGRCKP